ncbi:MAG: hypothetical protein M0T77_01360 [Actinomycetota bacterium]|nr:hypothetical protein [Actinomycetota bacterium]
MGYTWDLAAPVPLMLTDGFTRFNYGDSGLPQEQTGADGTVYCRLTNGRLFPDELVAIARSR